MDAQELNSLKSKVNRAEKIQKSIDNIDRMLKNIGTAGKCTKIEYDYQAPSKGLCFQLDDEGQGNYTYVETISQETLGVSEQEFNEWFSEPLKHFIAEFRNKLQKDLKNL